MHGLDSWTATIGRMTMLRQGEYATRIELVSYVLYELRHEGGDGKDHSGVRAAGRHHRVVLPVALSRGAAGEQPITSFLLGLHQLAAQAAVAAEAVHALRPLEVEALTELGALDHLV